MMADYQFSVIIPTLPMMPEAILDAAQNACGGIAPHELLYAALIVGSLCYHAVTYLMKIAPPRVNAPSSSAHGQWCSQYEALQSQVTASTACCHFTRLISASGSSDLGKH